MISNVKNILLALLAGLFIGMCAGYYAKGKFAQAGQVEAIVEQRKEDAQSVSGMQKDESELQATIRTSQGINKAIRKEITHHEIFTPQGTLGVGVAPCHDPVLDDGVIRLLNSARTQTIADPTTGSDAAGNATADTGPGQQSH